jgi:flagellar biosynthetic protein FliO
MELARSLFGVVILFGLLGALVWIARKKGALLGVLPSRSGGHMLQLVERVPLTANHSVHLVRAGDRTLLVGVHSTGMTLLCDLSEPRSTRT